MEAVKVLDVTLRDGGNRIDFHFKEEDLQQMLPPLDQSGIDYIEIGYRNGAIHPLPNLGIAGLCDKDYLLQCKSFIKKAAIAVMAHPKNLTSADLTELKACGVKLLRLCVTRGEIAGACSLITAAKDCGLDVSVNFIHVSQYSEDELDSAVNQAHDFAPTIIYFADSNGSLLPLNVHTIYEKYTTRYDIPFGFHAHDNIGLAQTNTLAAINAGAQYVDFSLSGMGKGIGNLRTEYFLAYLEALQVKKYKLEAVMPAANYVRRAFATMSDSIDMDEFIRGIHDLSTAEMKQVKQHELEI